MTTEADIATLERALAAGNMPDATRKMYQATLARLRPSTTPTTTPTTSKPTPPKAKRPGQVASVDDYQEPHEDFTKIPGRILAAILDVAPHPALRGYLYVVSIADRRTGRFFVSYGKVALRIGAKDRRHGMRVMRRLQKAGLVRLVERGGADHSANAYQLVDPTKVDVVALREEIRRPLNPKAEKAPLE